MWAWVSAVFGFMFLMLTYLIANEFFLVGQAWGLANASGYDTDVYTWLVSYWGIFPILILFAVAIWGFVQTQKQREQYY